MNSGRNIGGDMEEIESQQIGISTARSVVSEGESIEDIRNQARQATRDFKSSWRKLAQVLQVIWKEKLYREWGYDTFDQYTMREIAVRKRTAMNLIRSYMFLKNEEPLYLQNSGETSGAQEITPALEAVNTLRYAKKNLSGDEYQKVKNDLVNEGKDPREVKRGLTGLLIKRRKDIDPEKERTSRDRVIIKRFIGALQAFKREIETLYLLPGSIADDIDALINKIEKHISE